MKKVLLFAGFLLVPVLTQAQSKAIDALQRKYQGTEASLSLNLNGHLLRLLTWLNGENDPEVKAFVKDLRHVRMLKIPKRPHGMSLTDFQDLKSAVRRESFDELMSIRSDGGNVDILIKEKNDLVSELLLLANDQDDFVVMTLRGKIDLDKVFKVAGQVKVNDL